MPNLKREKVLYLRTIAAVYILEIPMLNVSCVWAILVSQHRWGVERLRRVEVSGVIVGSTDCKWHTLLFNIGTVFAALQPGARDML